MHNEQENVLKLREAANLIHTYQLERGWSDAQLCRELAHVGSTKTYKRILDDADDLDQLDITKQLRNYEAARETVQARRSKDKIAEPEYDDFDNVTTVRAALGRAMEEDGFQRFVCVEGDTATGKDASLNVVLRKWPAITIAVNANPFWAESFSAPTQAIFNALNIVRRKSREEGGGPLPMPRYPHDRAQAIFEALRERKLILAINEGHHCGVRMIDFIKTIINETPSVVAMFCHPALIRRLEMDNYAQSSQLFGNRLCERVYLPTPAANEIGIMMERRGVKFEDAGARNEAAKALAAEAPTLGNWTYVKLVTRELAAASRKAPLDLAAFNRHRTTIRNRRVPCGMQGRAA